MNQPFATRPLCLTLSLAVCLTGMSPAWAGPADDLRDLIGAKGAGAESDLQRRGYTHIDTSKSNSAGYSYWWSNAGSNCLRVTMRDGRVQALRDVDAADCGKTQSESGMGTGGKVALGAIALLGIAALAHKSHHRDDNNYNEQQTANFERGYRDGLYNHAYHNYGNNNEYSQGYNKGVEERNQQSSYRGGNWGRGGYQSYASVSDLSGRDTNYAWSQLESRGFQLSGERNIGRGRYQYFYWHSGNNQCVDIHTRDSRVESASEVGRYACNR